VAGWTGCYTSIMGLPLWLVMEMLAQVGIKTLGEVAEVCGELNSGKCCLNAPDDFVLPRSTTIMRPGCIGTDRHDEARRVVTSVMDEVLEIVHRTM